MTYPLWLRRPLCATRSRVNGRALTSFLPEPRGVSTRFGVYERPMTDRQFKSDLTGSGETLEHLLMRLREEVRRPMWPRRNGPSDWDHFVSSRRPPRGVGGAEAPIPRERPYPDACASV